MTAVRHKHEPKHERAAQSRSRSTRAVTTLQVHEVVIGLARLIVADNIHGYRRIEIVDETTVIVH